MLDKFLININASINDAIVKIEANSKGFVLVENDEKQVFGTLTDGDIRRALLAGAQLTDLAINHINKNFILLYCSISLVGKVAEGPFIWTRYRYLPVEPILSQ